MREIKFRAWNKETECFFKWDLSFAFGGTGKVWGNVEQFTGIYDEHGKEIYEGDIVLYYDLFFTIIFDYGMFYGNGKHDDIKLDSCDYNKIEIVGNIHQNPELLNV